MRLVSSARARSQRPGKVLLWLVGILALGMFSCCGFVGFFAMQSSKQKQEALAEADKLYSTNPAGAVSKYKEGYDAAGTRKAEVLQRIVDHEAGAGNTAEATKWIDKGLDDKLTPAYTSAAAKDLLVKAQKDRADRETAKKASEEAKKAEREAKTKDREDKSRKYTREEFKQLVIGKSRDEVIALLGTPKTTPQLGGVDLLEYPGRTTDPVTGKTDHNAQIAFDGDLASDVTFVRF